MALFELELEKEISGLLRELEDGTYRHGPYTLHEITRPKPRIIAASPYRDRVVHHALCGIIEPVLSSGFLFDSYACRPDKGTHRALRRYMEYARRFPFVLKGDIRKFFPSIDHGVLLGLIERKIKDPRVLELCVEIVGSYESGRRPLRKRGDDLLAVCGRKVGLPIGNLTSQLFANVILDPLDHLVKEELRLPGYVRYCDDFWCFSGSKEKLWEARDAVSEHLVGMRLRLHEKKTTLSRTSEPIRVLGYVARSDGRLRVAGDTVKRFRKRISSMRRGVASGDVSGERARASLMGFMSHARHARSRGLMELFMNELEVGGAA